MNRVEAPLVELTVDVVVERPLVVLGEKGVREEIDDQLLLWGQWCKECMLSLGHRVVLRLRLGDCSKELDRRG